MLKQKLFILHLHSFLSMQLNHAIVTIEKLF